ncbi:hypothetical protein GCG54_00013075, partial [Colletotrichum gloeosporioides]
PGHLGPRRRVPLRTEFCLPGRRRLAPSPVPYGVPTSPSLEPT